MNQTINDTTEFKTDYKIDDRFFGTLESILLDFAKKRNINNLPEIVVTATTKNSNYSFESIDEFLKSSDVILEYINEIRIHYSLFDTEKKGLTTVNLKIDCKHTRMFPGVVITYSATDEYAYIALKEKIEKLFKNSNVYYTYFAWLPFSVIILSLALALLVFYTSAHEIVYSESTQHFIIEVYFILMAIGVLCKPVKHAIFPRHELMFGKNKKVSERATWWQRMLFGTVILSLIINFISSKMF